jgi:hypothetical protein
MSSIIQPQHAFNKIPTLLNEELLMCQSLAAEARKKENQKLADRWDLVSQLVAGLIQHLNSSNQFSVITELLERNTINDRTIEAQEIAEYTTSSLAALVNYDTASAQKLIQYAEETKKSGIRYRHWLTIIKQTISSHNTFKKIDLDEVVKQYRANGLKSTEAGQEIIAQHWIEAACLAQEALRKKNLSTTSYVTSGNEILSKYWDLSRDASYEASQIKVEVALALEQGNKILAQKLDSLALLAEKIATYRENLVRSIINGEMTLIPHWKNAIAFLNKSLEATRTLITLSQEDPFLSYQKIMITSAENAAESHSDLISKLQKKGNPDLSSIQFAQQSYEEAVQAFESFNKGDLQTATTLKTKSTLYGDAYQLSKKAAATKAWYTLGIPFLYWKYQIKKMKKKIVSVQYCG